MSQKLKIWFFCLFALIILTLPISGGLALFLGLGFALIFKNPIPAQTKRLTPQFLQTAVVGLGAAMNLAVIFSTGIHGILFTTVGISFTLLLGWALGQWLRVDRTTSLLLSMGTAICGGSAIAALAPVINAKENEISVSLATVFVLNATALFLFPPLGHWAGFSEIQFGLWSALAIHDTSSVVGAAMQYGPQALEVATTVKLARALWIVPLTLLFGFFFNKKQHNHSKAAPTKKPWFILGFLIMSALMTWMEPLRFLAPTITTVSKHLMVLTLFLIGSGLSREALRSVGVAPLIQGLLLWFLAAGSSFFAITMGWINL